jgi:hypothetical protein
MRKVDVTSSFVWPTERTIMSDHDAEHSRQRRPAHAILERDLFTAPKLRERPIESRQFEQLPWPKNIFGNEATIAELMAELQQPLQNGRANLDNPNLDNLCGCGCGRQHKCNLMQTIRGPYGLGYSVVWFWSDACKGDWNRKRTENHVNGF